MLILNFVEKNNIKQRGLFRKKQKNREYKKSSFVCENIIFNVVELEDDDLNSKEIISLLNKYKGAVLDTNNKNFNDEFSAYLFDFSFYLKRAILSAFVSFLESCDVRDIVIYDSDFRFSQEYVRVAEISRRLVIYCNESKESVMFSKYCYNKFGLNVFINDRSVINEKNIHINLNNIKKRENISFYDGYNNKKIEPDSKYFISNSSVNKLISLGVSFDMACAAVGVVPFKKYILVEE